MAYVSLHQPFSFTGKMKWAGNTRELIRFVKRVKGEYADCGAIMQMSMTECQIYTEAEPGYKVSCSDGTNSEPTTKINRVQSKYLTAWNCVLYSKGSSIINLKASCVCIFHLLCYVPRLYL